MKYSQVFWEGGTRVVLGGSSTWEGGGGEGGGVRASLGWQAEACPTYAAQPSGSAVPPGLAAGWQPAAGCQPAPQVPHNCSTSALGFVIGIADYVGDGGGAETGSYGHIEYADVFTRLGPFPGDGVADGGETGRESHLIHGAGTVEPAGVLTAGLGQQLIAFRLLPTGGPIAETAAHLHGDGTGNPEPGWGRFPGGPEAGHIAGAGQKAGAGRKGGAGRKQFLGTAGMAGDHQPRHGPQ